MNSQGVHGDQGFPRASKPWVPHGKTAAILGPKHASRPAASGPPSVPLPQPEISLLRKAQRGDARAFSVLVTATRRRSSTTSCAWSATARSPRTSPRTCSSASTRTGGLLAALPVHDVAVPGGEEPGARRVAGARAAASPGRARRRRPARGGRRSAGADRDDRRRLARRRRSQSRTSRWRCSSETSSASPTRRSPTRSRSRSRRSSGGSTRPARRSSSPRP